MLIDAVRGKLGDMIADQVVRANLLEAATLDDLDDILSGKMNGTAFDKVIDYIKTLDDAVAQRLYSLTCVYFATFRL